jgi:hypothetical protein
MGVVDGRTAIRHFHMPPAFERREHHEEIRGAVSFVFIIAAHRAPRLHRDRGPRIAEQLPAGLVKKHKGTIRIARTFVNVQHIFHGRTKAASAAGGMTHCLFR